jgi:uncharacterized protein (DUF1015 family)
LPEIAAGRFVRYAGSNELSDRVCPPYDIIDEEGRRELEARSPANFVRLILPREHAGETPVDRYRRARATLDQWLSSGVMVRDDAPSLFVVEQSFSDPTTGVRRVRRGLQALVRLREFKEGVILPHERTLSGPKADRLELMKAVRAHLSPIFILYPDDTNEVLASVAATLEAPPTVTAEGAGAAHRAWRISDPKVIADVTERLRARKGYIADGHHRYETALEFRALARAQGRQVEGTALDYIPAFLCGMNDPGLVIFPTHRLVHSMGLSLEALSRGNAFFESVSLEPSALEGGSLTKTLGRLAEAGQQGIAFVAADRTGARLLSLRKDAPLQTVSGLSSIPAVRSFDITVLHNVLFEHALGMSREAQARQENLWYEKDAARAVARARSGEAELAFLLNPTRMQQVRDFAEAGEAMPQKSTYFFPKIIDGLALELIDDGAL